MKLYRFDDKIYSTCTVDPGGSKIYGYAFVKKWVPKEGRRIFAHSSKDKAAESFRRRKLKQIKIHQAVINRAKEALLLLKL